MTANITYKQSKDFTKDQITNLFHSVNWISANFPNRLFKALQNSSTVITAWDKDELVGLVRVIDDTQMVAFIHYVLVNPKHQGLGIATDYSPWQAMEVLYEWYVENGDTRTLANLQVLQSKLNHPRQ